MGVPQSGLDGAGIPHQDWMRVPPPPLGLDDGTPLLGLDGVPPFETGCGYPPPYREIEQLRGGRHASCIHAGGLSYFSMCKLLIFIRCSISIHVQCIFSSMKLTVVKMVLCLSILLLNCLWLQAALLAALCKSSDIFFTSKYSANVEAIFLRRNAHLSVLMLPTRCQLHCTQHPHCPLS